MDIRKEELPPGWGMALTPDGRPYYLDETRRETSWHLPADVVAEIMRARERKAAAAEAADQLRSVPAGPIATKAATRAAATGAAAGEELSVHVCEACSVDIDKGGASPLPLARFVGVAYAFALTAGIANNVPEPPPRKSAPPSQHDVSPDTERVLGSALWGISNVLERALRSPDAALAALKRVDAEFGVEALCRPQPQPQPRQTGPGAARS
ncbi:hypothetical protein FNF31_01123 [Cafeteria roenbergensis]|uniref:WW domain-containing protein n=1 Tax=Cafeteria roenbergensis TaxID=33653 RepID=A0A5A8DND4_CAFRO|nr:hypothetical protein FNF31_01123 [Cafeteria roenbergensis]